MLLKFLLTKIHRNYAYNYDLASHQFLSKYMSDQIFIVMACEVEFPRWWHNPPPIIPHPLPPAPIPLQEKHAYYKIKTNTIAGLRVQNNDLESTCILKVTEYFLKGSSEKLLF